MKTKENLNVGDKVNISSLKLEDEMETFIIYLSSTWDIEAEQNDHTIVQKLPQL